MCLVIQLFDLDDMFLDLLRGALEIVLPDGMLGITYVVKAEDRLHARI